MDVICHCVNIRKDGNRYQICAAAADGSGAQCFAATNDALVWPVWSADGQRIYVCNAPQLLQSGLLAVTLAGGAHETILPVSEAVSWPAVSPDGSTLAYLRGTDLSAGISPPPQEVRLLSLSTRQQTTVFRLDNVGVSDVGTHDVTGLTWAPDGQSLLVAVDRGRGQFGLERVALGGARQPLGTDFTFRPSNLRVTPDGRLLVLATPAQGGTSEIWSVDPASGGRQTLPLAGETPGAFDVSR